ncbi:hypothetical protein ACFTWH_16825 [Streptomyces sp. NPDC057011]|uniref:hypothetical protein n=1 Tax=unclassified Streptomyces TaxID=2593676 RepID=UPI00362F37DD
MTMTMPAHVTLICCSQCPADAPSSYRAQPDRLFRCLACGHLLDVRDLELDPEEAWIVSRDGLLGYTVTEPEAVAYGLDGAFAAVDRGADLVLKGLVLSEGQARAVALAVCAVLTTLENPAATLDDVTRTCFGYSAEELAARYGWRVRPAPEHTCPVCGGGVVLASRGWASCASAGCKWGDTAAVLTGGVAPGWEL